MVLPGSPVFATELAAWKDRVRAAAEGATIHVAIDSVGGRLLGDVADLLAERTGTVINFGSLGGETSDIRLFAPRSLTLKGVALGSWMRQPPEQRRADIALAQRLVFRAFGMIMIVRHFLSSGFRPQDRTIAVVAAAFITIADA